MKRWLLTLIIAAVFLFLPEFPAISRSLNLAYGAALDPGTSGGLSMDARCGYDGQVKGGRRVPLQVTIQNQGEGLFQGSLLVKIMESDGAVYEYVYSVQADVGESEELTYYIPIGSRSDQMFLTLSDRAGIELISKRLKLNLSTDVAELFIGVLSDSPHRLTYLDGAGVQMGSLRTRAIWMDQASMPQQKMGFDMFDVFLVTDYHIGQLSREQYDAMLDWANQGGILVFGTGERSLESAGVLADDLLSRGVSAPMSVEVDMGVEYGVSGPADSAIRLICTDLSLTEGNVILSSDELPVLTSASYGKGLVVMAAYDFVDIEEFCTLHSAYVDKIFTKIMGAERLNRIAMAAYGGSSEQYWSVQNVINGGSVDKLPNITLYIFLTGCYLLLIGPGLYLFLKKRDLSLYYRKGVLICAAVFSGLIYMAGSATRFYSPFFTYATVQDVGEDVIQEYTYINIRTPHNKPYQVELDPSYILRPITGNYEGNTSAMRFTGDEDYEISISQEPAQIAVSARNVASFSPRYFYLEKQFENAQKVGITADIHLFEGQVSGSITNHFDHAVEHVTVLCYGQMIMIDRLDAGETRSLDHIEVWNSPYGSPLVLAEVIAGTNKAERPDFGSRSYILDIERANLLAFYLDTFEREYVSDARIMAFSTEKTEGQFLKNKTNETYGLTLFTSTASVDRTKNGLISRTAMRRPPEVLGGSYFADTNTILGPEPVTLEYYLGNEVEIEKVRFEDISEEFLHTNQEIFQGTISFYNYNTRNFDQLKDSVRELDGIQLEPYLSPGNTITVRYQPGNDADHNFELMLPAIYTLGRGKD